jgi:hypothetical protein
MELAAGEIDKPSEQSERVGNAGEQCELTTTSQQGLVLGPESGVLPAGPVEVSSKDPKETPSQDTSDVKQLLAGIMKVIKQSHISLQESVRADLSVNNEKIQLFQEKVKADLSGVRADNEKIQLLQERVKTDLSGDNADLSNVKADISSKFSLLQEANAKFQENLRAETKA